VKIRKLVPQMVCGLVVLGGLAALAAAPAGAVMNCKLNPEARNVPLYDKPGGEIVRNVDVAADWSSEHGVFTSVGSSAGGDASLWVRVKDAQGAAVGYLSVTSGGVACGGGF
jgi:hypothetical protein